MNFAAEELVATLAANAVSGAPRSLFVRTQRTHKYQQRMVPGCSVAALRWRRHASATGRALLQHPVPGDLLICSGAPVCAFEVKAKASTAKAAIHITSDNAAPTSTFQTTWDPTNCRVFFGLGFKGLTVARAPLLLPHSESSLEDRYLGMCPLILTVLKGDFNKGYYNPS